MEERNASLRHRIPAEKRKECLKLFEEGYGYKKTAQLAGLNTYTVRDYKRRYASRTEHIYGEGLQEALCLRGQLLGRQGREHGFRLNMRVLA